MENGRILLSQLILALFTGMLVFKIIQVKEDLIKKLPVVFNGKDHQNFKQSLSPFGVEMESKLELLSKGILEIAGSCHQQLL